jgi:membrane protein DedA with SNARE-associated domain
LDLLQGLPDALLYLILGVSAFLENVFPPIPGDTITAFGAFLVGTRRLSFLGVYFSTTAGSLIGFLSLYLVGIRVGGAHFLRRNYRFFSAADIIKAEKWFSRYGAYLVLLNRFMPGLRSVISIVAGIVRIKPIIVTAYALLSCLAWNALWVSAGYLLGTNWEAMKEGMNRIITRYNAAVMVLFSAAAVFFLARRFLRKRARRKSEVLSKPLDRCG